MNPLRKESGLRGVVSLSSVTTPFFVGVPVKRQQPISVIIKILHETIFMLVLTFQSDSLSQFELNRVNW